MTTDAHPERHIPVVEDSDLAPDEAPGTPEEGIALCLSGGGYRAMLFHLGSLWRLNEMGLLQRISRFSSVSGGSITASVLAANWTELGFTDGIARHFVDKVVTPVRALASRTIDINSMAEGALLPGSVADWVGAAYRKYLGLGEKTLQDLPDEPRFIFNATNVQTKSIWRFSKPYMGDWRVGLVYHPATPLATAVAASSAFPPFLAPLVLELDPNQVCKVGECPLHSEPYTSEAVLVDGGVYDNMGLETAWKRYKTVLVSDAGVNMAPDPTPKRDWANLTYRVLFLFDAQVRSLRKRQLIGSYVDKQRTGAYWGIATPKSRYPKPTTLLCPTDHVSELAAMATRLKHLDSAYQERLINWGYAACDSSLRSHYLPEAAYPNDFPYPGSGV